MKSKLILTLIAFAATLICACKASTVEGAPGNPPETAGTQRAIPIPINSEPAEIPVPTRIEAKTVEVESPIESVTVYLDRAAVTRTAKVELEPGAYDLVFEKLPRRMDWSSVRAIGSEKISVVNLAVKREHILNPDDPQIAALEGQLKAKEAELGAIKDEIQTLGKKENLLDSIRARTGEQASERLEGELDLDSLTKVMNFLDNGYRSIAEERRELTGKKGAGRGQGTGSDPAQADAAGPAFAGR
jgi:hypothetical protein